LKGYSGGKQVVLVAKPGWASETRRGKERTNYGKKNPKGGKRHVAERIGKQGQGNARGEMTKFGLDGGKESLGDLGNLVPCTRSRWRVT